MCEMKLMLQPLAIGRDFLSGIGQELLRVVSPLAQRVEGALKIAWTHLSRFNNELDDALQACRRKVSEYIKFALTTLVAMNVIGTLSEISNEDIRQKQETAERMIGSMNVAPPTDGGMKAERHSLTVEEGISLSGIAITHRNYNPQQKHIVYFLGDDQIWQTTMPFMKLLHELTGANIYCYNYRGVALSQGFSLNEEVVIRDAERILKTLLDQGVSAKQIKIYGRSFGGTLALKIAALYAQRDIVFDAICERSYRSLLNHIRATAPFLGDLFASFVQKMGWTVDGEEALPHIKGKVICIYSEDDPRIAPTDNIKTAIERFFVGDKKEQAVIYKMNEIEFIKAHPQLAEDPACTAHVRKFAPCEMEEIAAAINRLWSSN